MTLIATAAFLGGVGTFGAAGCGFRFRGAMLCLSGVAAILVGSGTFLAHSTFLRV